MTGAIKDSVIQMQELAIYALKFLEKRYPDRLMDRYGIDHIDEDLVKTFDHIGKKRYMIGPDNEVDYEMTAEIIIRDIRNQHLGRITFDYRDEMIAEQDELA